MHGALHVMKMKGFIENIRIIVTITEKKRDVTIKSSVKIMVYINIGTP